ncbi:hypothetical protein Slin15195_G107030 [Septoria linicola]|uniref:Uncharacterized protein n=1 Tax=Septoria linicola TaxID=215465 RepID=A0A9Q9AYD6_9PEZI|nr:hypothetical protein Slin14017_G070000 [Septoria linicola]USW57384.1 hypothetical protein Slin15195_G107030 [Septoria linicola]
MNYQDYVGCDHVPFAENLNKQIQHQFKRLAYVNRVEQEHIDDLAELERQLNVARRIYAGWRVAVLEQEDEAPAGEVDKDEFEDFEEEVRLAGSAVERLKAFLERLIVELEDEAIEYEGEEGLGGEDEFGDEDEEIEDEEAVEYEEHYSADTSPQSEFGSKAPQKTIKASLATPAHPFFGGKGPVAVTDLFRNAELDLISEDESLVQEEADIDGPAVPSPLSSRRQFGSKGPVMATEVDTEVEEDLFGSGEQDLESNEQDLESDEQDLDREIKKDSNAKEISEMILGIMEEDSASPVNQTLTIDNTTPTESAQTHNKKRSFDSAFHIDGSEPKRPSQKQRTESHLHTPSDIPGTGRICFEVNIKATMQFSLEESQVEDEAPGRWRNEAGLREPEVKGETNGGKRDSASTKKDLSGNEGGADIEKGEKESNEEETEDSDNLNASEQATQTQDATVAPPQQVQAIPGQVQLPPAAPDPASTAPQFVPNPTQPPLSAAIPIPAAPQTKFIRLEVDTTPYHGLQPIPQAIWTLQALVKACPLDEDGLPISSSLGKLPATFTIPGTATQMTHFAPVGVLRVGKRQSPLWEFWMDSSLFTEDEWLRLNEKRGQAIKTQYRELPSRAYGRLVPARA